MRLALRSGVALLILGTAVACAQVPPSAATVSPTRAVQTPSASQEPTEPIAIEPTPGPTDPEDSNGKRFFEFLPKIPQILCNLTNSDTN